MFEDRGIIPKCSNGLDSETIHLYNEVWLKVLSLSLQNVHEDVYHLSKLKYPFALQECLSLNGAQQQYENINTSNKELKLTKKFSIPSFEKVKIKLSDISDPFVKNLSSKLRIVGFGGARASDIKMLLELLLRKFDWFGFSIKPKNFRFLTYTVANHLEVLKW